MGSRPDPQEVQAAHDAAAEAAKERDELQRSLDAARAEAVSSAAQLAQAVRREQTSTKAAEDNRKALAEVGTHTAVHRCLPLLSIVYRCLQLSTTVYYCSLVYTAVYRRVRLPSDTTGSLPFHCCERACVPITCTF